MDFVDYQDYAGPSRMNNHAPQMRAQTKTPDELKAELRALLQAGKVYFKTVNFAWDMVNKPTTPNRMYWIEKLVNDTNAYHTRTQTGALAPAPVGDKVDLTKVLEMFNFARQHLKRPKITLLLKGCGKIRISFDKSYTSLWLNNPLSYQGTYGTVDVANGSIYWRRAGLAIKQEVLDLLNEFCADPKAIAIQHGKLTGNCCFCQLPLSDPRSLHVGYGDTCASHYRLPWGEKTVFTAEGDWVLNGPSV